MKQQLTYARFTGWFRFGCTLLTSSLLYLSYYFINPEWFQDDYFQVCGVWAYIIDISCYTLGCYILSELCIQLSHRLDYYLPWDFNPLIRVVVQTISLTVIGIAFIVLVLWGVSFLVAPDNYEYSSTDLANFRYTLFLGGLSLLFFNVIYTGEYFFRSWRNSPLKAEEFKRASLLAQFEALKAQVDPHFLFNNLSTLTSLIEEDPSRAIEYVDKLSQVYRYVLHVRNSDLVYLSEEMAFIHAYLFLASIRFGNSLRVQIDLNGIADSSRIPPMTLQILFENAMKHNAVSPESPLSIRLNVTTPNWLVMRNTLQPKINPANLRYGASTGMGLQNIYKRYRHLGQRLPEVVQTQEEFIVSLPLL